MEFRLEHHLTQAIIMAHKGHLGSDHQFEKINLIFMQIQNFKLIWSRIGLSYLIALYCRIIQFFIASERYASGVHYYQDLQC